MPLAAYLTAVVAGCIFSLVGLFLIGLAIILTVIALSYLDKLRDMQERAIARSLRATMRVG